MTSDLSRRQFLAASTAAAAVEWIPQGAIDSARTVSASRSAEVALDFRPLELKLKHTWTIARNSSDAKRNGLLSLTAEGVTGFGEAAANVRYHQSFDSAAAAFARVQPAVRGLSPWAHRAWIERAESVVGDDSEITAALDMALWDWKGKRCGQPVHRLLGVDGAAMPKTSFSIGIDTAEAMQAKAREAASFPLLKLKVGNADDEANVRAVRAVTPKTIRVDANEGWKTKEEALAKIQWLASQGVELIEQPMPAADLESARWIASRAGMPVVADEAAMRAADLPALAGACQGANVKLSKCGGITRALEMAAVGRALGFKLMLGCMIESSLGIAAGVAIAPLFDWVDLDGNLLVSNDPFTGLAIDEGRWRLPDAPGLGVTLR